MLDANTIKALVEGEIEGDEIFVVDVLIKPVNRIFVFLDGEGGVKISDCSRISRSIENKLDRDIDDYSLEVSSAGLDYPIKLHRQYKINLGRKLKVNLLDNKQVEGELVEVGENEIILEEKKREKLEGHKKKQLITHRYNVVFSQIDRAFVVPTF